MDLIVRRATLAASTFNRQAGTVDAILSGGADVNRRDARGPFIERLDLGGLSIRNGADRVPLLDSHRRDSIAHVQGYADNIQNSGSEVRATLHIADQRTLDLIERGALTGVSIGYAPGAEKWLNADGTRVRSITAATLHETSLTEFPADSSAGLLRSDDMPPIIEPVNRAELNGQIRTLVRTAGLPVEFADGLIDRAASIDETRAAAFDEIQRRGVRVPATPVGPSNDDPAVMLGRMVDALSHRLTGAAGEPPEAARQFRGMSLHAMARTLLQARGEPGVLGMSPEQLITRAISVSDLPALLQSTGQRILEGQYQIALSPVFALARESTNNDFRKKSVIRLGEMELLSKVAEGGEVEHGGVAEMAEGYALDTYAKLFSLTRTAAINDDLGAFSSVSAAQGRAAAETANNLLVALLISNSGLGPVFATDSKNLFDAVHGNVGTAGAISTTTLAEGILKMRSQKGIDGSTPINVTPKTLLVPAGKELLARQGVAAFYPPTAADVNPFAGTLDVAVEPRLAGNRWFLFADKGIMPVLEYAYLAGAPGPQMLSRPGWEELGISFRVVLDFGCSAIDWRGSFTNAGA